MEATTIDQLFPAVLEEIFSHLSAADVKNCALVCKEWNEVIGSSEITMKKFKLRFGLVGDRDENSQKLDEWQQRHSTRKHRNLYLYFIDPPAHSPSPSSILEHFDLSQVKQLSFCAEFDETIKTIIATTLLSRMPLLEDLHISFYDTKFEDLGFSILTLAKLRKLHVHEGLTADSFFKFIVAPNITDLAYTEGNAGYPESEFSDAKIDSMADFIKDKKKLANLRFSARLFRKLIGRHDLSELRLKSLNVRCHHGSEPEHLEYSDTAQENLKKLLLTNADSMTSLQIPAGCISKDVLVAIFSGLRKLEKLNVEGDVNVNGSWMGNLSANITLKSLELTQSWMNDGLKKILQLAPNIESLKLSSATDSLLNQAATSNRRLLKLEIERLVINLRGSLGFNELKSLKLLRIDMVKSLATLLVSCPKIETFECHEFNGMQRNSTEMSNIVDILLQQNTLKHLRMPIFPPELCRNIFDQLKVNYGHLRSATFGMRGDNFIQFDFPEDPAEWNVEDQEARFTAYMARV